ncbi:hypothetical protein OIO90_005602 [Microbotryomycetes sp. JL221]|nr:hypothetical protein OIO90_005602 [Microbotryomycetes sp. JL221]
MSSRPSSIVGRVGHMSPLAMPSPTLSHVNRIVSSSSGTDKLFMLYSYSAYLAQAVLRSKRVSKLDWADRVQKLQTLISDARVLYRLFGLLPILSWAQSLNDPKQAPSDGQLKLIEKLQCWSMLLYYPLEHYYYLAGKGIFKATTERINKIAIWSCRFWAAYVALQVLHIRREYQLLALSKRQLGLARSRSEKSEVDSSTLVEQEKIEIQKIRAKETYLYNDSWVQAGYLPLTMHWSLPNGILPSSTWVGVCGTVAAAFGLRQTWAATA